MAAKGRKKEAVKFTADIIDCNAPVDKILDELRQRNPQAFMFYSYTLRPRCTHRTLYVNNHCSIPGHPLNAFDDDWDGELNLEYFEPFSYKSLPPKMITPMRNFNIADPVTSLIRKKNEWHHTCKTYKRIASRTRLMESYEELNDEVAQCQKHLVELAALLDSDPDPLADAPYSWRYAGRGNLQLARVDCDHYLLHSQFTTVYLSEFSTNTLTINMDHVASFDCGDGNNILETICSPENIVVLRTKHKIFILKLIKGHNRFTFEKLKCIESELQYTSVAFDNFHINILYITTLDYRLSIVNLDRMKARSVQLQGKVATLVNNWNTVVSSERGFYIHAGRTSVSIYDKRSNDMLHVWKDLRKITDDKTCNDISVAEHFPGSKSLYFGTDHHLFAMDLRYALKNGPQVVRRWTHCMESPPAYMSHCNFELSKDLICLSSQWCEDMCVVPNYSDRLIKDTDSGGVTMPYRPPSIFNALAEAKQMLLCQDLYNPIEGRLVTAITGNLIMEQGERYHILMQNSFGDISCHTLYPEHFESFVEDDSAQKLHEWSETYEAQRRDLEVSSIDDIAGVWRELRKLPEDYTIVTRHRKPRSRFNVKEIVEAFEEEKVDSGLREVWVGAPRPTVDEALPLHYSDEE